MQEVEEEPGEVVGGVGGGGGVLLHQIYDVSLSLIIHSSGPGSISNDRYMCGLNKKVVSIFSTPYTSPHELK